MGQKDRSKPDPNISNEEKDKPNRDRQTYRQTQLTEKNKKINGDENK